MKTIKIIDFLNKIANDEYNERTVFKYDNKTYNILTLSDIFVFNHSVLNDEVEIIEEEKKIEYLHFHDLTEPTENEKILIVQINKLNDLIKKALNNSTNR